MSSEEKQEYRTFLRQTAEEEKVPAEKIHEAIMAVRENIGSGYIMSFYWERGASDLISWYKNGIEQGKKLALTPSEEN